MAAGGGGAADEGVLHTHSVYDDFKKDRTLSEAYVARRCLRVARTRR
jgi:hypothetical protein